MTEQPATPELDKIKAISDHSQAIGEFLEWCQEEHLILAFYPLVREMYPERYTDEELSKRQNEWRRDNMDERSENLQPTNKGTLALLAKFFDIDQAKAEREREAVLEYVRTMQEVNQT